MTLNRRNALMATAAAAFSPWSRAAASTVWALPTGYRADSFQGRNLAEFARDVEAATGGALRIELHANNSLVPLKDIMASMLSGKTQAGEVIMSGLVKDIPIAGADSVPFIVSSFTDAQRLWKVQRPLIERHLAAQGLKPLFAVPWPPQCLYSIRPIKSADDLRGSKMRTYNLTTVRIAEMLGAQPVDVPMANVGAALAEGRIDTMITSAVTGVENKVWTSFKYFYEINAWFPKNLTLVNSKAFEALSPAQQRAVEGSALAAEVRGWGFSRVAARDSMDELKKNGMKIETAPQLLQPVLKRLGDRFSMEWLRSVGREANDVFVPYYARS
jgi:TRAP-type C4-dicarboxylate transport system substrate-binding protein